MNACKTVADAGKSPSYTSFTTRGHLPNPYRFFFVCFPPASGKTGLPSCLWFNISLRQMTNGVISGFRNLPGNRMLFTVRNPK